MSERILTRADAKGPMRTETDVVVVGSGAGGAALGKTLAEAGKSVVILEAGPHLTAEDFKQQSRPALSMLYYERGLRALLGNAVIATMQARCIGGSTTVNTGYCFRPPPEKLAHWAEADGLAEWADAAALAPIVEGVERTLGVAPTREAILGRHGRLFKQGAEKLGYRGDVARRNAPGCRGCGLCNYGCPVNAKLGSMLTYLPLAMLAGARVFAECRAEKVLVERGRAVGLVARFVAREEDEDGPTLEVRAKAVVLAAGAMATPVILEKNGLGGASGALGRNLHVHPGCGVVGRFAERVNWFDGVPQGYNVDEFHDDGYLIQNFTIPLEGAAPQIGGAGVAFKDRVADVLHFVGVGAMISEKKSSGRVEARRKGWRPKLGYRLDPVEIETFKRGLLHSGEILFAAGAEWVKPDVHGVGECRTLDDLRKSLARDFKASDFTCIGNHPQGSARMSADPKRGVVSPSGEVHGTPGLWVADASLFPSSLGVNPQITIMTMATKIAGNVAAAV